MKFGMCLTRNMRSTCTELPASWAVLGSGTNCFTKSSTCTSRRRRVRVCLGREIRKETLRCSHGTVRVGRRSDTSTQLAEASQNSCVELLYLSRIAELLACNTSMGLVAILKAQERAMHLLFRCADKNFQSRKCPKLLGKA